MRKLLILLLLGLAAPVMAQDFKILFVNTETIRIGGKDLSRGDLFSETDKVEWASDKQAMKVLSLADKKQYILSSEMFKKEKTKSAKDYLVRTNRLSTRGTGSLSMVRRQLGETLQVLDTTCVSVGYVPDEEEYFFLICGEDRFELGYSEGQLVFVPEIWEGKTEPVTGDLYFHYSDGEEELVTEELEIVPLPESVVTSRRRRR